MLLYFGDGWKVERVYVNAVTEEVDVFVEYLGKYAEDPDTLIQCHIYDRAPLRRWRHLDTMQYKTYINSYIPRVNDEKGKVKTINTPWGEKQIAVSGDHP